VRVGGWVMCVCECVCDVCAMCVCVCVCDHDNQKMRFLVMEVMKYEEKAKGRLRSCLRKAQPQVACPLLKQPAKAAHKQALHTHLFICSLSCLSCAFNLSTFF
jgi:hypothetical protein